MTWGWLGIFKRAFEFVNGAMEAVSPIGNARLRYNHAVGDFEKSISGAPYVLFDGGSDGALAQATWYIDAATGSDANVGDTPATALQTFGEWSRRIGGGRATVAMTVNLLTDLDEDEYVVRGSFPLTLFIQGERTTLITGTVTGGQAWNTGVSPVQDGRITAAALPGTWSNSGPGGTSLVGSMIVLTSGPNAGMTGWVLADLGGKTARVSLFTDVFTLATGNAAIGNTFTVVSLTELDGGTMVVDTQDVPGFGFVDFEDLHLAQSVPTWVLVGRGGPFFLGNCKLSGQGSMIEDCNFGAYGTFFNHTGGIDLLSCRNCQVFSCSSFCEYTVGGGSVVAFDETNPCQRVNAASILNVGSYGYAAIRGSFGCVGTGVTAADAIVEVDTYAQLSVESVGKVWGLSMTGGFGVWIDSMGGAFWTDGDAATVHFDFSGAGFNGFQIGGVNSTVAALGTAGSITAANNAAAIPQQLSP